MTCVVSFREGSMPATSAKSRDFVIGFGGVAGWPTIVTAKVTHHWFRVRTCLAIAGKRLARGLGRLRCGAPMTRADGLLPTNNTFSNAALEIALPGSMDDPIKDPSIGEIAPKQCARRRRATATSDKFSECSGSRRKYDKIADLAGE